MSEKRIGTSGLSGVKLGYTGVLRSGKSVFSDESMVVIIGDRKIKIWQLHGEKFSASQMSALKDVLHYSSIVLVFGSEELAHDLQTHDVDSVKRSFVSIRVDVVI